jgi:hypothetical protein
MLDVPFAVVVRLVAAGPIARATDQWIGYGRRPGPRRTQSHEARPGMNGLATAEKPHGRHGLTKDRRSPDLIQLHYRGKTEEIRLETGIAGGCS